MVDWALLGCYASPFMSNLISPARCAREKNCSLEGSRRGTRYREDATARAFYIDPVDTRVGIDPAQEGGEEHEGIRRGRRRGARGDPPLEEIRRSQRGIHYGSESYLDQVTTAICSSLAPFLGQHHQVDHSLFHLGAPSSVPFTGGGS